MTTRLLTQREVCRLLKLSPKTLQILRRTRQIPFVKFGHRSIRFRPDEIQEFVRQREVRL
jgi:excisionase family DNA binding protein